MTSLDFKWWTKSDCCVSSIHRPLLAIAVLVFCLVGELSAVSCPFKFDVHIDPLRRFEGMSCKWFFTEELMNKLKTCDLLKPNLIY